MINLAKGRVPVADIMGQTTDATLALAAADSLELGPAADIVNKQLGVWGETSITAAQWPTNWHNRQYAAAVNR